MSKVVRLIAARDTGYKTPLRSRVAFSVNSEFVRESPYASRYEIECRVGGTASVTDRMRGRELTAAIQAVQRAVVEEIFGEFRPVLSDIEMALWNDDVEEAQRLVKALREQMFTVEETPR